MKKYLIITILLFSSLIYAQQSPVTIKWTAELNGDWYALDSVVITNKSNGEKMTVLYSDTIFVYQNLRITPTNPEMKTALRVFPNPFSNSTQVEFSLAQYGEADLAVYDMLGREVLRRVSVLERGTHSFTISLPQGIYTLNLQTVAGNSSVRLISEGNVTPKITYNSIISSTQKVFQKVYKSNNTDFPCEYGDTLVLQGFITVNDTVLVEKHSVPLTKDTLISFMFSTPKDTLLTLIDSLIGEWNWFKVYGGIGGGTWENYFKSTIKILSQNEDASINYEVFADDTLFHEGSFQVWYEPQIGGVANIKLPFLPSEQKWWICFRNFPTQETNEDFLTFSMLAIDGYSFVYEKIK